MTEPLRILTWHVHGSYLFNLVQSDHEFYLPVKDGRPEGYGGRSGHFAWPYNVHDIPASEVRDLTLDIVVTQSRKNFLEDRYEILSNEQLRLPTVHLEHDPPTEHPTDQHHFVDDPNILLVHVTAFNDLMWDCGRTPTTIVEHGVIAPEYIRYSGELARGLVAVNNLHARGRRLGGDVFDRVREKVPLDLAGMGSEPYGGLGDLPHGRLLELMAKYRFVFNPIRHTSLGLAVCEAMMVGVPVIGLATTEMPMIVGNGVSGFIDTNIDRLVEHMQRLLADPAEAEQLGRGARSFASQKFSIHRFIQDWNEVFTAVTRAMRASSVSDTTQSIRTGELQ